MNMLVASKGAPEAVADSVPSRHRATRRTGCADQCAGGSRLARTGCGPLHLQGREWPAIQHDFEFEFVGLIGLADPVRPTVSAALRECDTAGIRVVMDHRRYPATASAIAQQTGLAIGQAALSAARVINQMDDATLRERARHSNIFARMVPQQKLRLVNALKANGEVVAMTGRRCQRRTGAESGTYRHRDGRSRHRCGARSVCTGTAG